MAIENSTINAVVTTGQTTSVAATEADKSQRLRWLYIVFWIIAVALGLLHAWSGRYEVSPDGISYLDMGDAYLRGDWQMAVNAYWSPLYSWLLGAALLLLQPSSYWEFPTAHLVNFFIYLGALASFSFLLHEVICYWRVERDGFTGQRTLRLPEWAWVALGYSLFIWTSLELVTLRYVTPDMCVAALVYLAAGLIVRMRRGAGDWLTFVLFGVVLGVGYLAKAAMFPLAFVFLGVSLFAVGDVRRAVGRVLVALVMFLLVSSPFLIALSRAKGRLTFGDSGRLNYAWYVNGIPGVYWQGEPEGSGTPQHPARKVMDVPEVYEFGIPVGGTYPHWYDPSYWNEGLAPHFDLSQQIKTMVSGAKVYYYFLFPLALRGSLIIGLFILLYMSGRGWLVFTDVAASWFLLAPALAAFTMYSLVHAEERFIGSFITLLFVGLFAGVRLLDSRESRRLVQCVMIIIVAMFCLTVGSPSARAAYAAMRDVIKGDAEPYVNWQVAEGLKRMGVYSGAKVAVLNTSIGPPGYLGNIRSSDNMRWARLARLQIVAEVYSREGDNNFWAADDATRQRVVEAFMQAGAKIIVDDKSPGWAAAEGWQRIGNTKHYVYFLPRR